MLYQTSTRFIVQSTNSNSFYIFVPPSSTLLPCITISFTHSGLLTGIYTTNTADSTGYVCNMSKANIAVVENDQQMQKIRSVWDTLPYLKAVIQYDNKLKQKYDNCYNVSLRLSDGSSYLSSSLYTVHNCCCWCHFSWGV